MTGSVTQSRKGWQAAGCRGTEHISTDISLLRVGLGPPVSACALPWANSDRNACPNSVPGEPASQPDGLIGLPCPSPIPNQPLFCPLVLADQCARPFQGSPLRVPILPWQGPHAVIEGVGAPALTRQEGGERGVLERAIDGCHVVSIWPMPAQLCSLLLQWHPSL